MSPASITIPPAIPARSLSEAAQQLMLFELPPDDPRYTRLDEGRATKELTKLEAFLRNASRNPNAHAKCAFVGSRGTGKSTYLLHLEDELEKAGAFTPVHIYLDASLESDCHYTNLLLWTADEIARQFQDRGHPVAEKELARVAEWFADKSITDVSEWKKQLELDAHAGVSSKLGIPGMLALRMMAQLRSRIVGSQDSRQEMRRKLQNYVSQLMELMNGFLDHAREVLRKAGKPDRLLTVHDNLDRMHPPENARRLFVSGSDVLLDLRADVIYTAPLVLNLAPLDIGRIFGNVFTMPNVKVRRRDGSNHKPGIDSLVTLMDRRLAFKEVFGGMKVARYLAEMSGGSVRELLRLVAEAQLEAQVAGKTKVDMKSAKAAVTKKAVNIARLLMPTSVYYPILAKVHLTKSEYQIGSEDATSERVASARGFFAEMIGNEAVLEYNGDDCWYDVHPAIRESALFQDALAKASQS